TLDTIDWQKPSAETILNRIVPRAKDGAIVLMHPTASTLAALPQMIRALNAKGYKIVSVSRLIAAHQEAAGAEVNA
ncbi:MAG TPA: polysaccharide deacetylase, partial [Limnochordia bacterium]|nr:polysaccharide deacetylase [Limnochordia bacterium]